MYTPTSMGPIQGFFGLGGVSKFTFNGVGKAWFVDSVAGEDVDSFGKTFGRALKTITKALDRADPGDTIYLSGSFNESVVCDKAGVRFVGVGNGPLQATWNAPAVKDEDVFCLKMAASSIRAENIRFRPVKLDTSGVPSAIQLAGANWAQIVGCRFQGQAGSIAAIYSPVCDSDNVLIENNEFFYMNTATNGVAILGVEAGGLSYSGWTIARNHFNSCVTAVDVNLRASSVLGNIFDVVGITAAGAAGTVMTKGLDPSGDNSGGNAINGNYLGGTYALALYKPSEGGDNWMGNYASIVADKCPNGVTVLPPAV